MSDIYTSGRWRPNPGSETQFVEAWKEFATWASSRPGAGTLRLLHDLDDPGRFVSFGNWESADAVADWKSSAEFRGRMANILQHVAVFEPSESAVVADAEAGAVTTHSAV
jgi:heme-degrading monooxygenase HmoA